MKNFIEKFIQNENGIQWGWISLGSLIPMYIWMGISWLDWNEWFRGAPYIILYIWSFFIVFFFPLLILIQLEVVIKQLIKRKTLSLELLVLLFLTTGFYGFATKKCG